MWRSRPSFIPADMNAEVMVSALSRALLGGRHAPEYVGEGGAFHATSLDVSWTTVINTRVRGVPALVWISTREEGTGVSAS
jgi:hypothetical protein